MSRKNTQRAISLTHSKLPLKCFKISPSIVRIKHTGLNSNFNFETANENEVCKTFSSFIC